MFKSFDIILSDIQFFINIRNKNEYKMNKIKRNKYKMK
jgi:hypothetical protein